jgi:ketosteroid isomerase-like protein
MSQENIDIPKRLIEAYNRRDIPAFLELLHPDVEWIPIMAALEGRVYCGHDGVRQWVNDIAEDWEYFEPCLVEFHDLGERVLIFGHWRARGRVSGVEFDNQPASWLYEIKGGKVVWMRTFTDRAEALEAAGLSE